MRTCTVVIKSFLSCQYGGWYADTDYVFLKSLVGMKNILCQNVKSLRSDHLNITHITNSALNLGKVFSLQT